MAPNRASAASASASMSASEDTSVRCPSTGTPAADNSATAVLPANSSTNESPNECRPLTKRTSDDPDQRAGRLQPAQRVGGAVQRHALRHQPLDRHLPGRQAADGLPVGLAGEPA